MKTDKLTGTVPRVKRRAGVMPTRREKEVNKVIPRREKHKKPVDLGKSSVT